MGIEYLELRKRINTFSEARQNLAEVLDREKSEEVVIKRRAGDTFVLVYQLWRDPHLTMFLELLSPA